MRPFFRMPPRARHARACSPNERAPRPTSARRVDECDRAAVRFARGRDRTERRDEKGAGRSRAQRAPRGAAYRRPGGADALRLPPDGPVLWAFRDAQWLVAGRVLLYIR